MKSHTLGTTLRRTIGALLILLVVFPLFRLLTWGTVGAIEADIMNAAERARALLTFGTLIVVLVGILLARIIGISSIERFASTFTRWIVAIPRARFAAILAIVSSLVTAIFTRYVLDGKPPMFDAMAQLLQARYVAAGHIAGPVGLWSPFVTIQNFIVLPTGWVSQYPPGHVALLAIGFLLHGVWLVGPVLMGITVFFTALAADRLLPSDLGVARLASVLVALSPFLIALAGAYMNHVTAAAGIAAAVYSALRSRDERFTAWSIATGVALGCIFAVRPLSAVTTGCVVTFLWLDCYDDRTPWPDRIQHTLRHLAAAVAGALPLTLAVFVYDNRLFGAPLRIGYMVAQGPGMRLGFHLDPWGNWYGPLQALAYTSSDLTTLSLNLLETPVPAVVLCGLYLLLARRLTPGIRTLAVWALVPVLANVFYWHHGIFMGPRMLNEVAPAWILLTVVSTIELVRRIPRERRIGPYEFQSAAALMGIVALGGSLLYLAPQRLRSYGDPFMQSTRIPIPQTTRPSLIFVHGAWPTRIAMRLAGAGMRLDSVETVMHQNPTCAVDAFAKTYVAASPAERRALVQSVDFTPAPRKQFATLDGSPDVHLRPGERLTPTCLQELWSDRLGILDVSPFGWQGDLPGLPATGAMLVRDLGPEANQQLIQAFPAREPLIWYRPAPDAVPRLSSYSAGMTILWGSS